MGLGLAWFLQVFLLPSGGPVRLLVSAATCLAQVAPSAHSLAFSLSLNLRYKPLD